MTVALDDEVLRLLRRNLKHGEYNDVDIMHAWLAIDELLEIRSWREKAFVAHPNIDIDIEVICDGAWTT